MNQIPKLNVIGAGRLGTCLARYWSSRGMVAIAGVCNTSIRSAQAAIDIIGQGDAIETINALPAADFTMIATIDGAIEACARTLSESANLQAGSIIFHLSGALSSDILCATHSKNCKVASVHPFKSFPRPDESIESFTGTYCAFEGGEEAVDVLKPMFTGLGAITIDIQTQHKMRYHAGAVVASNHPVTLCHIAQKALIDAGINEQQALEMAVGIMQKTLDNVLLRQSTKQALTGPIKRGETDIIEQHLACFPEKIQLKVYKALALATIDITDLSEAKADELTALLES